MQKTFNAFEKATVKNSAKAVAHYQAKNETIDKKIKELETEKEMNNAYIEQYSAPVRELTGGYDPLELCEKVSRGSQNDWVFKYPATIVPPVTTAELIKEDEEKEREKKEKEEIVSTVENSVEDSTPMFEDEQPSVEDPFAETQEDFPTQEEDDRFNPDEF
jgi:hypothetical protein